MPDTYCGKLCDECPQREALACPGCKSGPGGTCDLSRCCRQKGHENCSTCSFSQNCHLQLQKDTMPRRRQMEQDAKRAKAESLKRQAAFYSKWLWPLFWLVIPGTIASIMTNDTIAGYFPSLFLPGTILSAVSSFAYGGLLLKLSTEEYLYRIPGITTLITGAISLFLSLTCGSTNPDGAILFTLPAAILSLVAEYTEINAHSTILANVDGALSENWLSLWKWYIGLYGASIGSIVLMLFGSLLALLGLLVALAASIGLVVIGILKLVYLYQTASVFSDCLRDSESGLTIQ